MNRVATLCEDLAASGLQLRKAHPRGPDRLGMELVAVDGRICAGQWHADATETARAAGVLRDRFGAASAGVLGRGRLLVQYGGADRELGTLRQLVASPGAALVVHRPERRAVVRLGTDRYVKVVRPGRTAAVSLPLRRVPPDGLRVPEVLDVDDDAGLVTLGAVAGPTLLERLGAPGPDDTALIEDTRRLGRAVRRLHDHTTRPWRPLHDRAAELLTARRWLEAASGHGLLDPVVWRPLLDRVGSRLPAIEGAPSLLHRDLHDKQVILGPGADVGLLDLDLVVHGDPALDLANLLVHLDLRSRQGICARQRAEGCASAFLEGYAPDAALVRRIPAYAACSRLRLAGVYCFREEPASLVAGLLRDVGRAISISYRT